MGPVFDERSMVKTLVEDMHKFSVDTDKLMHFLENSMNNDFEGRCEYSDKSDLQEAETFLNLTSAVLGDSAGDRYHIFERKEMLGAMDTLRKSFKESIDKTLDNMQKEKGVDAICKPSNMFEYYCTRFFTSEACRGFKFVNLFDTPEVFMDWLKPLPRVMSYFAHYKPDCLCDFIGIFFMNKIGQAECQMAILGEMLYKIFTAQDFWDVVYHKTSVLTYDIASKLLVVAGTDATVWGNSNYGRWSKLSDKLNAVKKISHHLSTVQDILILLIGSSPVALEEIRNSPHFNTSMEIRLNAKQSGFSTTGLLYLQGLLTCETDAIAPLLTPDIISYFTSEKKIQLQGRTIPCSLSTEFVNLAKFALSTDYVKLQGVIRDMRNLRVSPSSIDISMLARGASAILPISNDKLFNHLIKDFYLIDPLTFLLKYILTWIPYFIRFNTVWSLRYADRVVDAVKTLAPEFDEYSSNPILLLKRASEKWIEDEQHIKAEQERETAERAAKMKEAAAQLERERLEAIEKMESERKGKLKAEGFQLASDSGRYEKWLKDNTCRIFFKTTSPEEKKGVLIGLEELGISASKVRNIKNPAGIIRTITIGEDEIYSDSLIESALHKAARFKPEGPVFNTEIVSTAFDLVFDKTFFELDWLDKAIVRALDNKVSIQDARYCTKVMRDRGIIGQIKGKKNGPKIFALTPEGYSLYQIQKDYPNLPILAVPWEKYIGEEVAERLGTLQYFDITTRPVKDIDKMIAGKTPRFLDKYYVTAI